MEERILTIKWIDFEDKIVKFIEESDPVYDIQDDANTYAQKLNLGAGAKVTVKIDASKGEHGLIINIKSKDNPVNTPSSSESKPDVSSYTNLTIKSKSETNISFNEVSDNFLLDKKVAYYMSKAKIEVNDKVNIELGDNNTVIKIQKVKHESKAEVKNDYDKAPATTEAKTESSSTTTQKKTYSNDVQTSIEAQASVNSACSLVGDLVGDSKLESAQVLKMIRVIAENNFQLIQDLKNR